MQIVDADEPRDVAVAGIERGIDRPADFRGVVTGEYPAPEAGFASFEARHARQHLHDPADCIAAVQGRRRTAQYFNAIDRTRRYERHVLCWRVAKYCVVQSHPIDDVQDLRSLEAANDGSPLPWRCLLQINTGLCGERIGRQFDAANVIGRDDR